jgi:hypothetical protein
MLALLLLLLIGWLGLLLVSLVLVSGMLLVIGLVLFGYWLLSYVFRMMR